jgi:sterol desaturase/sphingolipid hydroxylase (fatty acid hydroxylase superfamily)
MLAANCGYWGMSLMCFGLDCCLQLEGRKMQGRKSLAFSFGDYFHVASVGFINMTLVACMCSVAFGWLWDLVPNRKTEEDQFVWPREAVNLVLFSLIVDVWFYWTHRALHWPPLYRTVHKYHHRYKAPCAAAAVYAHPIEFVFGNVGGIALGPILTNAHPFSAYAWYFIALVSTCASHSGYDMFGAEKHDDHHRLFDCNYGVGPLCDWLFGTLLDPARSGSMVGKRSGLGKSPSRGE